MQFCKDIDEVGVWMPNRLGGTLCGTPHENRAGTDSPLAPTVQHYCPQYFLLLTGTFQLLAG
jgi:hypothetical protein